MILERIGKAIKKPAKNTLVSFAASEIGTGKGFAYQEFLDQLGAFLGPVLLFVTALVKGTDDLFTTYRISFAILLVPAMITIALVLTAKIRYPDPEIFEKQEEKPVVRVIEKETVPEETVEVSLSEEVSEEAETPEDNSGEEPEEIDLSAPSEENEKEEAVK